MSRMANILKSYIGAGATIGRSRSGPEDIFANPDRDLIHCLPIILGEAVSNTYAIYAELDDQESVETVDTISKMFLMQHAAAMEDNVSGLMQIEDLYKYLEDSELKLKVYANFCVAFLQSTYCYLFSIRTMPMGMRPMSEDHIQYTKLLDLVSKLDKEEREIVMTNIQKKHLWPAPDKIHQVLRRLDSFVEIIKEDQQARYKEAGGK